MQIDLIQSLILFITGGFLVFLAITVMRENFANRINRATGMVLFFAGLGPLALALGSVIVETPDISGSFQDNPIYNLRYLWEFFFPALLVFSWVFPVDRLRHFRPPYLRFIVVVPQLVHFLLVFFHAQLIHLLNTVAESSERTGFSEIILKPIGWLATQVISLVGLLMTNEQVIFGIVNLVYVLIAVFFLESGIRYVTNPRLLYQARIVLWGTRLGLGLCLLANLSWYFWYSDSAEIVGSYLLIMGIMGGTTFFAYAIIRHQFLSVQLVFRQSFIYTFTSVLLVGIYIALGMRSREFLTPLFGERAEEISYLFILFILLLFQPISSWIDNVIRSMFMRTSTDHRNILERFSRQVITIFDPKQLHQTIEEVLKTSLLVDQVYFILYDDGVGEYAIMKSSDHPHRTVIDREDLMLRGINLLDTPTRFSALGDFQDGSKLGDILTEMRVRLILPLKDSQHLLGFLALTSKAAGYRYTAEDFNLLGVLSNQMVSALTNARLYVDSLERMRLEDEVNMARQIQLDLLPSNPPAIPCSVICASSTPSRTVGGDFYDFISIDNNKRIGMVIADASGKGMPAALLIAQIQAIIRSEINNGNPIPVIMKNMNQQVALSTSSEKYVTLFYGELDIGNGMFHYANAGHNYPLLVRAEGKVEHLEEGGPVIGAFPDFEYKSSTVRLRKDDLLFLFTDGLSEAMDTEGKEYGEARIEEFLVDRRSENPKTLLDGILKDVRVFDPTHPPQDDTTIITLKMTDRIIGNE